MDISVKKSNKENSRPEGGPQKTELKQKLMRPAPLLSKNQQRKETTGDDNTQHKPSKPIKSIDSDPTQRKTLSQTFRTQQTLRHKKLVLEIQKPPSSVPPKPLPGTYKGRVVQSKIDCFRKPPRGLEKKLEVETAVKSRSTTMLSASSIGSTQSGLGSRTTGLDARKTFPQRQVQVKPATVPTKPSTISTKLSTASTKPSTLSRKPPMVSTKPSSVSTKPSSVSTKPSSVSTKPSSVSTKPSSVSTKPSSVTTKPSSVTTKPSAISTKASAISRKPSAVSTKLSAISRKPVPMSARPPPVTSFIKKKEPSKPAANASKQKPIKSTSTSISQYRVQVESAEERRVKLTEWLESKGKTLKRPAMSEKSSLQNQNQNQNLQPNPGDEASERLQMCQSEVPQRKPAFSDSPSHILNTTLDLLDHSDTDDLPAEPEIRMDMLVVNLCERLEAMETPSSCGNGSRAGGKSDAEVKVEEETSEFEILEEEEMMHTKGEEKKTVTFMKEEECESDEEDDEDACVVKYSVKTTPFLQSVKKRMMDDEMAPGTPGSRRKSSIKELKFLTPVRRSSRIHKNSSRLPDMLNEHDPCVSSLAELELLDSADSNAYIYRKNPALLHLHHPDQRPETPITENA